MNYQDFQKGIDFTGLPTVTGADHNNLIELAIPLSYGDETKGKSLCIVTTDTALNVPEVPDPNTDTEYNKWKRYPWFRRSFNGSIPPKLYLWDDNKPNHVTYLKWYEVSVDLTELESDIANALASAQNAETVAGAVAATSQNALNSAQNAVTVAQTAVATANTANTTANTALTNSTSAQTAANNAQVSATSALAKRSASDVLLPGTSRQILRTNSAGNNVEWFSIKDTVAILQETTALGNDSTYAGGAARQPNLVFSDPSDLVDLVNDGVVNEIKFKVAGRYKIKVYFPWYFTASGSAGTLKASIQFAESTGSGKYLQGTSYGLSNIQTGSGDRALPALMIEGYLDIAVNEQYVITSNMTATNITIGGGRASNQAGLPNEIYMQIELQLVS